MTIDEELERAHALFCQMSTAKKGLAAALAYLHGCANRRNHALKEEVAFWRAEYAAIARAGVERLKDFGVEADPAEKMIEAAEYRLQRAMEKMKETANVTG